MVTIDDDNDPTPADLAFWDAGGHPPWKRVWRDGVDVTDQDPSTWPALWNIGVRSPKAGRRARRG